MAYTGLVQRWDIFWVDLDFPVGSEQGGNRRPALIISNDSANANLPVVTQLPLTKLEGKKRRAYPFEVILPQGVISDRVTSIIMPQQIRTIDKARLLERAGSLQDAALRVQVENRLLEYLGIAFEL